MGTFRFGEPPADDNPLPVKVLSALSGPFVIGEPPSDDNPLPVRLVDGAAAAGLFTKASIGSAFALPTTSTISLKAGTVIELNGWLHVFSSDTPVVLPALTAGVDYAIYVCVDGSVRADASFTAPAGYTAAEARQIGGFHYALGAGAAAQAGGGSSPVINPYSVWDQRWRPKCPDPRGMALINNTFWADIYLCGVDHHVNGTSAYNVTIADGSSPPKVHPVFGGNGTTTYGSFTWYEANELMKGHGKGLPDQGEFAALAYGVTEAGSIGVEPSLTALDALRTSKWGIMQATGNMWVWGRDFGFIPSGADFAALLANSAKAQTEGRGSVYTFGSSGLCVAIFGGNWSFGSYSGSRSSSWNITPWNSLNSSIFGARGRSDHLAY
jgi:hypothetical protein